MNAYERRRKILKKKRDLRQEQKKLDMLEHQDKVMLQFEVAFRSAHGYTPSVYYRNGWYAVSGVKPFKRYREQDLIIEARKLWAKKHSEEMGGFDD